MCLVVLSMSNANDVPRYAVLANFTNLSLVDNVVSRRRWMLAVPVHIPDKKRNGEDIGGRTDFRTIRKHNVTSP